LKDHPAGGITSKASVSTDPRRLSEAQLALAALVSLVAGERDALPLLRALLRRVNPTLLRPMS